MRSDGIDVLNQGPRLLGLRAAGVGEAGLVGGDDDLCAVSGAEFEHGAVDVSFDGEWRDDELFGDLIVTQAVPDEGDDFAFAVGDR